MKAPKRLTDRLTILEAQIAELKEKIDAEEAKSTEDVVYELRERLQTLEAERELYLKLDTSRLRDLCAQHKHLVGGAAVLAVIIGISLWNPAALLLVAFGGLGVIAWRKNKRST